MVSGHDRLTDHQCQLLVTGVARLYAPWSVGDTVIWDNQGVLHRAMPYEPGSAREMLRTTVLGDEPIQ